MDSDNDVATLPHRWHPGLSGRSHLVHDQMYSILRALWKSQVTTLKVYPFSKWWIVKATEKLKKFRVGAIFVIYCVTLVLAGIEHCNIIFLCVDLNTSLVG